MRTARPFHLLLGLNLTLLATGCDRADSPLEPPAGPDMTPVEAEPATLATARWADGYLTTLAATSEYYSPAANTSYNRSGGGILVTRPAGTTGRYVVTFTGLSAIIGTKSTVRVTGYGADPSYCKPMSGTLISDKVEVRCFKMGSATPLNASFSLVVLGKSSARAFAFAHQPTSTNYAPSGPGSWNPPGTSKIIRSSVGMYQVVFNNLASKLAGKGGQVQVNAVASNKAHCKAVEEWGGSTNVGVGVQCYTPTGSPVDAKFTVLFHLPAPHLAYAYANQPTAQEYEAEPFWSSNPAGGSAIVRRVSPGFFDIEWPGAMGSIIEYGNPQVTAVGLYDYAQCKVSNGLIARIYVRCFAPNGALVDVPFTVMLGS